MTADDLFTQLPGGGEPVAQEPSPDPDLPGPFTVGSWASGFKDFLKSRPRVLLIGEIFNLNHSRTSTYFELRDADGAARCAIWNSDLDKLKLPEGALKDGAEVVIAGGPDYYPGSKTASPSFSFRATYIRLAGEGDLLAQLERSRRKLEAEGLFDNQRALPRPAIPKTIGVVTARKSAACADLLAGLERRGWRGTIVWADAPVQDRRAAGAIAGALRGLAAIPQVEIAVVCRGGGSLTDLWAFCDESLCRTVALLRLPVVSAVGHELDRTLIDDVAAVSCSTPTHAADALVQLDVNTARAHLRTAAGLTSRTAKKAVAGRALRLADCLRAPTRSLRDERSRLHQILREIRASSGRGVGRRLELAGRHALVVSRKGGSFATVDTAARSRLTGIARAINARTVAALTTDSRHLDTLARAVDSHHPQRTLERGYALVTDSEGDTVVSARAAREHRHVAIRFADDAVGATVDPEPPADGSDDATE